jgi:hypothetical protein
MKNAIFLMVILATSGIISRACDHCGSDGGNGILPTDSRSFISLGYRRSLFSGIDEDASFREVFQRYELNVKQVWKNKWEVAMTLPYAGFTNTHGGFLRDDFSGLGDISLVARKIFTSKVQLPSAHRLAVGGGMELPTGAHEFIGHDAVINPFQQPGSGSFDVMGQIQYSFKFNNWGLLSSLNGKYNGRNNIGQRLPIQYSMQADVFRSFTLGASARIVARGGVVYDKFSTAYYVGPEMYRSLSGQGFTIGQASLEVYTGNLWLSAQAGRRVNPAPSDLPRSVNIRFALNMGFMF